MLEPPDAFGSGVTGLLELDGGAKVTFQIFAGFEEVPDEDLVTSSTAPPLRRVALHRYLADKLQCVVERLEARDLVDIAAVVRRRPELGPAMRRAIASQDELLLVERLLGWTDAALREDLRAHVDVEPTDAMTMRDEILAIVRAQEDG